MDNNDIARLKQDALETLSSLDPDKLNKDMFLLVGASVAILNSPVNEDDIIPSQASLISEPQSGVLDDFSVILSRYANSRSATDRDIMRETLKQQLNAIEKELVEMRLEVHDEIAVQYFIDFRENLRLKL